MVKMSGIYLGEKHCKLTHEQSKSHIETDAPKDNHGRGENFSPTDLLGAALGSCMLTVMGIWAEQNNLDIKGSKFHLSKEMTANPRRVSRLTVNIHLPKSLSAENRTKIEAVANTCPVKMSLHPDVQIPLTFDYSV